MDRAGLTARGYDRLLRVARTIADLADREDVRAEDLAEALQFRRSPIDTVESADSNVLEVGG
jgi:predicted ATPase with chaperone activity